MKKKSYYTVIKELAKARARIHYLESLLKVMSTADYACGYFQDGEFVHTHDVMTKNEICDLARHAVNLTP